MTDTTATAAPGAPAATAAEATKFADTEALDQLAEDLSAAEADAGAARAPAAAPGAAMLDASKFQGEAAMLIGLGLDMLGKKVGVTFDAETKAEGADRLAPVLAKYDGAMPPWLKEYQHEFMLGIWFAGVAYKTWETVKAAKEADLKNASTTAHAQAE